MNFLPLAHNSISGTEKALRSLIEPRFTFPGSKESACNAGGLGSIPGSGKSPGEGNGYPLQYPCLENPMGRGADGPQSMGSQRVSYGLATNTLTFTYIQGVVVSTVKITEFLRSPAVAELNSLGQ